MSETTDNCTHTCYRCNKKLKNVYYWTGDKYICEECYDFWHKPMYSRLERDELYDKLKANQNQKAIECLEEVWKDFEKRLFGKELGDKIYVGSICNIINSVIDNKIKELEKEDE